jgi:hypothetical protein
MVPKIPSINGFSVVIRGLWRFGMLVGHEVATSKVNVKDKAKRRYVNKDIPTQVSARCLTSVL